jgi:hypothetical protein
MKVRIKTAPREREMDGVKLDAMEPGTIREVSAGIGAWLIVEGYAEPEMRQQPPDESSRQVQVPPLVERRRSDHR